MDLDWTLRYPRQPIAGDANVKTLRVEWACRLVDLAPGGALLAGDGPAPVADGELVLVELTLGGTTYAAWAWALPRGERLAIAFEEVSPPLAEAIVATLEQRPPVPPAVLVVDDDPDLRAMVAAALRRAGYQATEAGDGQEALELLRAEPERFAAVILDYVMPRLDGGGFCAAQKADPAIAGIPVVLATSSAPEEIAEVPVARVLHKPLRAERLLASIAACV